jgi:hypothetical protein
VQIDIGGAAAWPIGGHGIDDDQMTALDQIRAPLAKFVIRTTRAVRPIFRAFDLCVYAAYQIR